MADKVVSQFVNTFMFSDTKEEMRDSMDIPALSSIPILSGGNIYVGGIIPRFVTIDKIETDVPAMGEYVILPDNSYCSCVGNGVNTVIELRWEGTNIVNVTTAYATANVDSGTLYIRPNANAVEINILDNVSSIVNSVRFYPVNGELFSNERKSFTYSIVVKTNQSSDILFEHIMALANTSHDGCFLQIASQYAIGVSTGCVAYNHNGWNDA